MQILCVIQNGKWSPGVGDPTLIAWLIVAAYVTAALLSAWCAWRGAANQQKKQQAFWLILAILLVLLAVNKQLDLQTWLTSIARSISRERGWYQQRRFFQMCVVVVIAAVGGCFIMLAGWLMRDCGRHRLAFIGLVLLLVFIVVRSASLHPLDDVLSLEYAGIKLRHALELGAIGCIATSAFSCLFFTGSR